MTKNLKISSEDSDNVQNKFYEYNSLLDIISVIDSKSEIYSDILNRLSNSKKELEILKLSTFKKYKSDISDVDTYEFDFLNNSIEYVEK